MHMQNTCLLYMSCVYRSIHQLNREQDVCVYMLITINENRTRKTHKHTYARTQTLNMARSVEKVTENEMN